MSALRADAPGDAAEPPWLPEGFQPDGRRLARGPVADVWAAREEFTGRQVAVKLWHRPLRGRRPHDMYRRELDAHRLLAGVSGHVVTWAGGQPHDRLPWIATSLHGESLRSVLDREGRPPPNEATVLGMDVLRGLTAVHACGLLHRDVKPENVLVRDGRAVLADLGLATLAGEPVLDPRAGTPPYLAPEQRVGASPDHRTDVYAAGLVLRELLGDPAPHPGLERVLVRASSSRAADRPGSAMDLASRYSDAATDAGFRLPTPRAPDPVPPFLQRHGDRPRRRLPRLSELPQPVKAAVVTYVVVAALIGTVVIFGVLVVALTTGLFGS